MLRRRGYSFSTYAKFSEQLTFLTPLVFPYKSYCECTKSSNQDCGPCFLHLPIFFLYTLLFCWKIKRFCDRCFLQQMRPQITVQLYILLGYSSLRIGFNMIKKRQTLPVVYIHPVSLNLLSFYRHCFTQS